MRKLFTLDESHVLALEAYRVRCGLRSHAEAVRHMISASAVLTPRLPAANAVKPVPGPKVQKPVVETVKPPVQSGWDAVGLGRPQSVPGSRLKKGKGK